MLSHKIFRFDEFRPVLDLMTNKTTRFRFNCFANESRHHWIGTSSIFGSENEPTHIDFHSWHFPPQFFDIFLGWNFGFHSNACFRLNANFFHNKISIPIFTQMTQLFRERECQNDRFCDIWHCSSYVSKCRACCWCYSIDSVYYYAFASIIVSMVNERMSDTRCGWWISSPIFNCITLSPNEIRSKRQKDHHAQRINSW